MRVHVGGLPGELLFEARRGVGLVAQRRATHRGADEREVDPRFGTLRPDLLVLDLVEAPRVRPNTPAHGVPALVAGNVLNRRQRVVVEDQLDREGVVGVDQQRQLLVPRELIEWRRGELTEVRLERGCVLPNAFVIDQPCSSTWARRSPSKVEWSKVGPPGLSSWASWVVTTGGRPSSRSTDRRTPSWCVIAQTDSPKIASAATAVSPELLWPVIQSSSFPSLTVRRRMRHGLFSFSCRWLRSVRSRGSVTCVVPHDRNPLHRFSGEDAAPRCFGRIDRQGME